MHKKDSVLSALLQQQLLPLYYHEDSQISIRIMKALYDAGIRLVEYTNRGPNALVNFAALKQQAVQTMPGLMLGIGTIKTAEQAERYIDAGADFIVCPTTHAPVGKVTEEAGLLWIPGCMTPTEIAAAEAAGARLVKIFPGNVLGPGYVSAIKELFPGMLFMPTGGVEATHENLSAWFRAGVCAVGMGSKLVSASLVKEENYEGIRLLTEEALNAVRDARRIID